MHALFQRRAIPNARVLAAFVPMLVSQVSHPLIMAAVYGGSYQGLIMPAALAALAGAALVLTIVWRPGT